MNRSFISSLVLTAFLAGCSDSDDNSSPVLDPVATLDLSRGGYACYEMDTSKGSMVLALDEDNAPVTTAHFKEQVDSDYYDGVIFHSVLKDFAVQAGSVTEGLEQKDTVEAIQSEQTNGLQNFRGRIAMVRNFNNYNSAKADFILNVTDNDHYNNGNLSDGGGLTVFGGVVQGIDVLDAISATALTQKGDYLDIPIENVVINDIVQMSSCPASSETITDHVKVDKDPAPELDLSRGGYACYNMVTSMGNIELALDETKAPISAANFKSYVDDGFYDGTVYHRVINDFMIQGGGFDADLTIKETKDPIYNESINDLKNYRGRIAMARTSNLHSATSQFFINTVDNHSLDYNFENSGARGYAVFGGVINGIDVVDAIEEVDTTTKEGLADTPETTVTIDSVTTMACPD